MPVRSADPGQSFPAGPPHRDFMGRFGDAYAAELAAFIEVAAERTASPCTLEDALEAFYVAEACELSRERQQAVLVAEVRPGGQR
jgi:myo-inositol 2-dehydrogenase/D-chiro-inositol 1-dehydrogenase